MEIFFDDGETLPVFELNLQHLCLGHLHPWTSRSPDIQVPGHPGLWTTMPPEIHVVDIQASWELPVKMVKNGKNGNNCKIGKNCNNGNNG